MGLAKYFLSALAVAAVASAQTCNGTLNIQNSGDTAVLQSCTTWTGNVIIESTASGTIALNGVKIITGDLTCNNATQLTALQADQLQEIQGTWGMNGLTILSTLAFSSISSVKNIDWISLPALQGLNFGSSGITQASAVLISNTQLNTLTGIELKTVAAIDINNNPYLNMVNINDLTNVTTSLSFSANAAGLTLSFPNLQAAANLTFRNVSAVTMPSLSSVGGSMGFYSDTFQSFVAPNLTATGNSLTFADCGNLNNISFPLLKEIGGAFLIANNTNLLAIEGFPSLQVIVGALDFAGAFGNVSLPSLRDSRGGSNVQTSSTNDVCSLFNTLHSNQTIKGTNTCVRGKGNPSIDPNATGGGSSSSATSKSDASVFDPTAPLTGLSAIIAAILMI